MSKIDIYDLYFQNCEQIALSIEDDKLSDLSKLMAAFFLIEKVYLKTGNREEIEELYSYFPNRASCIHWFSDMLDEFFRIRERENADTKITDPFLNLRNQKEWKLKLRKALRELQKNNYLKITKSYNWHEHELKLQPKLLIYQIPYSVLSTNQEVLQNAS